MWRELVPALSIANLCYIEVWASLLHPAYQFFRKAPPSPMSIAAAMLGVLGLTALFWAALVVSRRAPWAPTRRLGQGLFLLGCLLSGYFVLRHILGRLLPRLGFFAWEGPVEILFVGLIVVALVLWLRQDVRAARVWALVFFPVFLITLAQAGWLLLRPHEPSAFLDAPPVPVRPGKAHESQRVLWLILDEMDFRLSFPERPQSVRLSEMDRLRQQSIFAANAFEPNTYTYLSMPSLLSGELLRNAIPQGPNSMRLVPVRPESETATLQENLFAEAHAAGFDTAVVGWYLPYCRVVGGKLAGCSWETVYFQHEEGMSLLDFVSQQLWLIADNVPFAARLRLADKVASRRLIHLRRTYHYHAYEKILAAARAVVVDPRLDLVFVHWPVPHAPAIYDRKRDTFDLRGESSYLDNLELADRTLGEVRRWLEEAGLWDSTVVLVSADHGWKWDYWQTQPLWNEEEAEVAVRLDARVPFLLKLAGQRREFDYSPAFNTVLTKDLLLALLRSQLSAPEEVEAWLDTHRGSVGLRPTDPPR